MEIPIRRGLLVSAMVCATLIPSCVSPTSGTHAAATSNLSGRTDIPMLVLSGKPAKWQLRTLKFDEDGKPSYSLGWKNPSRLQSHYNIGIDASAKLPEMPKTYQPDGYSAEEKPIVLQEVFIPAIGKKIRYYCKSGAGGSENAIFATEPIAWPDGHGGTVYYVIETESDEPGKILNQVEWEKPGSMADAKVVAEE